GMSVSERVSNLLNDFMSHGNREPALGRLKYKVVQRQAVSVLHYDERRLRCRIFIHVVDSDNAGMREAACRLSFAKKTLTVLLSAGAIRLQDGNGLNGDHAVDLGISRAKDRAHGPAAELGENFIPPHLLRGLHWAHLRGRVGAMIARDSPGFAATT